MHGDPHQGDAGPFRFRARDLGRAERLFEIHLVSHCGFGIIIELHFAVGMVGGRKLSYRACTLLATGLVVIGAVLLDIQRTKAANRVKKS